MHCFRIYTILLLSLLILTACGGGSEDQAQPSTLLTTSTPIIELSSSDILADPNATFKTSKQVSFAAYNESDNNITLFIFDNLTNQLARYYIDARSHAEINIQLAVAQTSVLISWNYLEHVKQQNIEVAELTQINFTGF